MCGVVEEKNEEKKVSPLSQQRATESQVCGTQQFC